MGCVLLQQDPNALDAYESQYWLADARYWLGRAQIELGRRRLRRRSRGRGKRRSTCGTRTRTTSTCSRRRYYVVSIAETGARGRVPQVRGVEAALPGIEKREEVQFTGEGVRHARWSRIRSRRRSWTRSRRATSTTRAFPLDRDPKQNGLLYAFQAADYFFVYGQFEQARARGTSRSTTSTAARTSGATSPGRSSSAWQLRAATRQARASSRRARAALTTKRRRSPKTVCASR